MAFESSIEKVGIYKNGCVGQTQVPCTSRMQIPSGRNLQRILEISPVVQVKMIEKVQQSVSFKGEIEYTVTYVDANNAVDAFAYVAEYEGVVETAADAEIMLRAYVENVHTTFETNSEIGVEANVCVQAMGLVGENIAVCNVQEENLVQQTKEVSVCKVSATGKDMFRVVGEYNAEEQVQNLLRAKAHVMVETAVSKTDMCTLQGKVVYNLLYTNNENRVQQAVVEVDFTQDVPCMGMQEEQMVEAYTHIAHVVAKEVEKETETSSFSLEAEVEVQMCAYETSSVEVVTDMYSTEKELELTTEACPIQMVEQCAYNVLQASVEVEKEESMRVLGAEITSVTPLASKADDKQNVIHFEVGVRLLCQNAEDVYVVKNEIAEVACETEIAANVQAVLTATGVVLHMKQTDTMVRLSCAISLFAQSAQQQVITFVSNVIEKEDIAEEEGALRFYMTEKGEDLFTIAKHLHVKPQDLQEQNPDLSFEDTENKVVAYYKQKQVSF